LVRSVEFGGSVLVRMQGRWWGEVNKKTGQIGFAFYEYHYSATDLRFVDRKRNVWMRVNLPERKIYIGSQDQTGSGIQPLYDVTAVSAQSRIAGSTIAWETQRAPDALIGPIFGLTASDTNTRFAKEKRDGEPCAPGETGSPTAIAGAKSDSKYKKCEVATAPAPVAATPATPAPAAKPTVTGQTVRMVDSGSIAWVQLKDGHWGEVVKSSGKIAFVFEVTARSEDEVQFIDRKRSLLLRTNLKDNKIYFGTVAQKTATQLLGTIVATSNSSLVPGTAAAWATRCPPPELVVRLSGIIAATVCVEG
jgi:hypothetical protein